MNRDSTAKTSGARPAVLSLLWAFAFVSYVLRVNIAVAQQLMARELRLSDIQVGYVFSAFLIGYTIFQVPAGFLGDRFGPRLVLAVSGLWWALTTLLTGFVPGLLARGALAAIGSLLVLRFLHGVGEASTFPVAARAVTDWFAPPRHAFITAVIFTGSTLGSAFAPPLVAQIMSVLGWRATFYVTSVLPLVVAALWWRVTPNSEGRRTTTNRKQLAGRVSHAGWWCLLIQQNVFFLCLSYFLYCYSISIFVYWLFKYLVDVRGLSIVNSGWTNSLPWILATIAVPLLGYVSARASGKLGVLAARRTVAAPCLLVAALLLWPGVYARTIGAAISAIAVSVALLFSTESSYWSTAIDIAPKDAGALSGLMNLAGNLGGVLSTLLVPLLVLHFDWSRALLSGSGFAILATICWFFVKTDKTPGLAEPPAEHSRKLVV